MKIGEFDVVIAGFADRDGLCAEVSKDDFQLATVQLENGVPIIEIGPNRKNEFGVWTIDYRTFKQIMKALDEFLASIGYPIEAEEP